MRTVATKDGTIEWGTGSIAYPPGHTGATMPPFRQANWLKFDRWYRYDHAFPRLYELIINAQNFTTAELFELAKDDLIAIGDDS